MESKRYDSFAQRMSEIADLGHSIAVLSWDKEVNLPKASAPARSRQIATLSAIMHNKFTDPALGDLLHSLAENESLDERQAKNVKVAREEYEKSTKFTEDFVIKKSNAISQAYHSWLEAREKKDYAVYIPALENLIKIKREEADILGYEAHPYDALLDQYEPKLTVSQLEPIFQGVKNDLVPLIGQYKKEIDNDFLYLKYDKDKQWQFGLKVLENMGYDFNRGRQDISPHPFTTSFSPLDVRVTTRIDEHDFGNMTWSCIHEGGHALYEQGLPLDNGLATGSYVSLAIHESQSRLWENHVGRSRDYWSYMLPKAKAIFPALAEVSLDQFYKGINKIQANLIRTEADELHYHIHVLIRYEIEKSLMENTIEVSSLKDYWNDKYAAYMGVHPPNDNKGLLQDIHWAHGSLGYFPTYSLGSFYAAQFYHAAEQRIEYLPEQLRRGDTGNLLKWLRDNIHQHGRLYEADELCTRVTGEPLNVNYFLNYAKKKYDEIYG